MRKSKLLAVAMSVMCAAALMTGCGSNGNAGSDAGSSSGGSASQPISVVSREDGSGTRGAFVELTGVEEKDADDTFHDKSRNLCSTCIDTAVKNRTADEITDHHDHDTDNAGDGCTDLKHIGGESCAVGNVTDHKAHDTFDDQCWDDPLGITGQEIRKCRADAAGQKTCHRAEEDA